MGEASNLPPAFKCQRVFARAWIKSQQIARIVSAEKEMPRGCKYPRDSFPVAEFPVIPHHLAGAVVERAASVELAHRIPVAASPSLCFPFRGIVINAEEAAAVHIEQPRLRIKAWRHPIGGSVRTGFDKRAIRSWRGFWLGNRPSSTVNPICPSLIDELRCNQMISVRAIQHEKNPVAACLRHQLARLAFEFRVEQHGRLYRIPIVHIVGRGLIIPNEVCRCPDSGQRSSK